MGSKITICPFEYDNTYFDTQINPYYHIFNCSFPLIIINSYQRVSVYLISLPLTT